MSKVHELNGQNLTQETAWVIARGDQVGMAASALEKLEHAHEVLMQAACMGQPIYGLTVGVGLNKDQSLFRSDEVVDERILKASEQFNYSALRSHSSAMGDPVPEQLVRLSMVIRLNTILSGMTGVQPYVATLYQLFLNHGITPVIPSKGTVGSADILMSSHIGLAMIGEWDVYYQGRRVPSLEVMQKLGIRPLVPKGKDALSILSNNSISVAYAMEAAQEAQHALKISATVIALSLEGFNGNLTPFLPQTNAIRPFPYLESSANGILAQLEGSFLWQTCEKRHLQDPLSFRTSAYALSGAHKALADLNDMINIQINHSDDNPAVILDLDEAYLSKPEMAKYLVNEDSAIFPTANFEPLPVSLAVQQLSVAMTHVSHNSVMRTIHLSDSSLTKLSRFLKAEGNLGHAFGAIQKNFVDLQVRNRKLARPVSYDGIAIAGSIEDTFSNLKFAADNLLEIIDNYMMTLGLEIMHAAQAVDLRKIAVANLSLGEHTQQLFKRYREVVTFVTLDRPFTPDIQKSYQFVRHY